MDFIAIIPARFLSSRLPGKPLKIINGKPMILHVMEKVISSKANRVIIATDDYKIYQVVKKAYGEVFLTSNIHKSGTERISEIIKKLNFKNDQIIINVQGDEPLILPELINKVIFNFIKLNPSIETLAVPIVSEKEMNNFNIIKLITDINNYAIYFSRSSIPFINNKKNFFKNYKNEIKKNIFRHIGIYAYTAGFIKKYLSWPESFLEKIESLEQLRVLKYGKKIHVTITNKYSGISVDTKEDLNIVKKIFKKYK
ncbi:3-deoxy-manno-octulosonate cytidylyltransferase [Sodalis-like secondary symbiont of Drepanosiphum platanoidis]|uniref:3-deoxy-manno-octulosonate cytidylyltransferase n=1 Tax=Sodalis-like secondary symbiont of Drepanosiphum platanoidis TaxID=2994493 RepID=UPI0034646867